MGDRVEGLTKVEDDHVNLVFVVERFEDVADGGDQLAFAGMATTKPVL